MHRVVSGLIHKKDVVTQVKNDSKVITSDENEKQLLEEMELMGINIKS